jgi:hypothetical protein
MKNRIGVLVLAFASALAVAGGLLLTPPPEPAVPLSMAGAVATPSRFAAPTPLPPPSSDVVFRDLLSRPIPEQRAAWHSMLREDSGVHDACIYLAQVGDDSSVPLPIAALRRYPVHPDGSMTCSRYHCLQALKAITHQSLGSSAETWARWWAHHQSRTPGPA